MLFKTKQGDFFKSNPFLNLVINFWINADAHEYKYGHIWYNECICLPQLVALRESFMWKIMTTFSFRNTYLIIHDEALPYMGNPRHNLYFYDVFIYFDRTIRCDTVYDFQLPRDTQADP